MPRKRVPIPVVSVEVSPARKKPWVEWMRLVIGGAEWTVFQTNADELERLNDGKPCDGLTIAETSSIYVDEAQAADRQVVILVHELLHASLSCVGAGYVIALINGLEKASEREETLVSYVAPILAGALRPILRVSPPKKRH